LGGRWQRLETDVGFPVRFSLSLSLFFFAFEIKKERKAENLTRNPSVYSLFIFSFTVSKSLEEVKEREDEETGTPSAQGSGLSARPWNQDSAS
jgi:hypothetical protein